MAMDNYHLVLQQEGHGYRHYLDDREVYPGTMLELQVGTDWVLGRFQWNFDHETRPYLVIDADRDDTISLSEHSILRWPKNQG